MSKTGVRYPQVRVQLIGRDGNAFVIIGTVAEALRRQVGRDAADAFASEAMDSESYDKLLAFVRHTVEVY